MTRQRLRIVSEQRIARVAAELSKRCPLFGVKLSTDGSATVLTAEGSVHLSGAGDGANPWDEVLAK